MPPHSSWCPSVSTCSKHKAPQINSVLTLGHLSPPAYSKNYFKHGVWETILSCILPIQWPGRTCGKNHEEDSKWKLRPPRFLGQWQCCSGHSIIPKYPNPRHWPITGTTPTSLPTPWFHSFTANPLQATPWMGSSCTTLGWTPPPPKHQNIRMVQ